MKFTQTGLPFNFARSMVSPPNSGSTSAGAGWPTWNWPAIGDRGGSVGRGVGEASDGTASDGSVSEGSPDASAVADGAPDGREADGDATAVRAGNVGPWSRELRVWLP